MCCQVDVVGTLQFWDVTIDTATSILITLSVGLAVDYSAHVGHMFMTILGNREGRLTTCLRYIVYFLNISEDLLMF